MEDNEEQHPIVNGSTIIERKPKVSELGKPGGESDCGDENRNVGNADEGGGYGSYVLRILPPSPSRASTM